MKEFKINIEWQEFIIKNQEDLAVIFKLFKEKTKDCDLIHWSVIMTLDQDLLEVITDYTWLIKCLKYLNEKNGYLLLVNTWDLLSKVITNSNQFAEILSKIPSEYNKLRLIKRFRVQNLMNLIHNATDLWILLSWLYKDTQKEFIDFLWHENIKKIFLSTHELIIILYYLNWDNKDYLMDILWLSNIKNKIKTYQNFLVLFKSLSFNYSKKMLKLYTKDEVLKLFRTDEDFNDFLLKLPTDREKLFLKFIWLS